MRIILLLLITILIGNQTVEAKKKTFGNGLYWEITKHGELIISGNGDMISKTNKKGGDYPWSKKGKKITKVTVEEGITSVGDCFLYNGWNKYFPYVTEVKLPSTLKNIGNSAFSSLNIRTISLPEGLENIGEYAFSHCKELREIIMPNSVIEIGDDVFSGCKLKKLILSEKLTKIPDGMLAYGSLQSIIIPDNVESIGSSAFLNTSLREVHLPKSLRGIGESAFANCNLKYIELPLSIEYIREDAFGFYKYNSLYDGDIINLPEFVTYASCKKYGISTEAYERSKNGEVGIVNSKGKRILDPQKGRKVMKITNDYISDIYYVITSNNQKGLIDDDGNWLLPIEYSSIIMKIDNGQVYFDVEKGSSHGRMSTDGKWVIPASKGHQGFSLFSADNGSMYYRVANGYFGTYGPFGLYDSNGNVIVYAEYDELEYIGGELLKYKKSGNYGVMTLQGKDIISTDRGYTSIDGYDRSRSVIKFSKDDKNYWRSGECDLTGKQLFIKETKRPKEMTNVSTNNTSNLRKYNDAIIFDLKGNVKKCTITSKNTSTVLYFDRNGKLTSSNPDYKLTRNSSGRVISSKRGYNITYYSYDSSGRVDYEKNEKGDKRFYKYDNHGHIVRITGENGMNFKYTIISTDSNGNWTKQRSVTETASEYGVLGVLFSGIDTEYFRQIEYY